MSCVCCERHAESCDSLTEEPGGWDRDCDGCCCCSWCGHDPTYDIYDPSKGDDFYCCEDQYWSQHPEHAPAWWVQQQEEEAQAYDDAVNA